MMLRSGEKAERNSLKEAYLLAALSKQKMAEMKKAMAIIIASAGAKPDAIKSAVEEMLAENFPEIAESREAFVELSQRILEQEAGKIQSLAEYKPLKL